MQVRRCNKTKQPTVRACRKLPRAPTVHERRENARQQEDNKQEQHKEQNGNDTCASAGKLLLIRLVYPAGDKAQSGCGHAAVYNTVVASRTYQGANVHRCKKGVRKKRCFTIPPAGYRGHGWAPTASQRITPGSLSTTYIISSGNYTLPNLHVPVATGQPTPGPHARQPKQTQSDGNMNSPELHAPQRTAECLRR